jgi:hypothetical protein
MSRTAVAHRQQCFIGGRNLGVRWLPRRTEVRFALVIFFLALGFVLLDRRDFTAEGMTISVLVSAAFVIVPFPLWRRFRDSSLSGD